MVGFALSSRVLRAALANWPDFLADILLDATERLISS